MIFAVGLAVVIVGIATNDVPAFAVGAFAIIASFVWLE